MATRTVRSTLVGIALVLTLSTVLPAATEAAGLTPALRDGNVVELVLHWILDLWGGDRDGGTAVRTISTSTGTGTGTGTTSGTASCGGDQGVCIDPNG